MMKIIVVGDVIWDQYAYRTIVGGSDAAVKVVPQPGGAANVFRSVANLYNSAYLISVVGQDSSGQDAERALQRYPNVILFSEPDRITPTKKWNFVDGIFESKESIECNNPILAISEQAIYSSIEAIVADGDIIVISDYCKGLISDTLVLSLLSIAKARGACVLVDSKRQNYSIFQDVYLVKQNRSEAQNIVNNIILTAEDLEGALRKIQNMTRSLNVVITLDATGMCLLMDRDRFLFLDQPTRTSRSDIVGAGDIVLAISALSIALGQPLHKSLRLAGALVAAKAGCDGTVFVEAEDLRLLAESTPSSGPLNAGQFYESLKGYPFEYMSQRL
jgi:D-beta-D-heptose 7-phosphate kinase/D-beta-D-heptose 1-phosphate adenosyltransferase